MTVPITLETITRVARVYDLVMTHKLDADDFFIHRVQQHCAERGLNFFLVEPLWAETFYRYFEAGEIWARVLLNMHSEHHQPGELYHRLVKLADQRHTRVIDSPHIALAAFNKALLHPKLVAAGIPVPPTVLVTQEQAGAFTLSEQEREILGNSFVIKPSMGYGRRGVLLDARSESDLQRSLDLWPDPHYLLQRLIVPRWHGERPAYFRVYFAFGSVWFTWWNCFTDEYRLLSPEEMEQYELWPLREIVCHMAALTRMQFFSSEIAQTESNEFFVIDYVNDQCHLLTQSASPRNGVPDQLVAALAARLVEGAQQLLRA